MAYEASQPLKVGNFTAAADLSAKQYYFVKLASATTVDVCSAVTDVPIGVLQNKPTSGQPAEIVVLGLTKVNVDADIAALDWIGPASDGQIAKVTIGTDTTVHVCGRIITEPGAAGEIHTAVIDCITPSRGIANIL